MGPPVRSDAPSSRMPTRRPSALPKLGASTSSASGSLAKLSTITTTTTSANHNRTTVQSPPAYSPPPADADDSTPTASSLTFPTSPPSTNNINISNATSDNSAAFFRDPDATPVPSAAQINHRLSTAIPRKVSTPPSIAPSMRSTTNRQHIKSQSTSDVHPLAVSTTPSITGSRTPLPAATPSASPARSRVVSMSNTPTRSVASPKVAVKLAVPSPKPITASPKPTGVTATPKGKTPLRSITAAASTTGAFDTPPKPLLTRHAEHVEQLGMMPGVPWGSNGSLSMAMAMRAGGSPLGSGVGGGGGLTGEASLWGDGEMSVEMMTEVAAPGEEVDEDMEAALHQVKVVHSRKLIHYKRLLEQAQSSTASQLHALQAELRILRTTVEQERRVARQHELARDKDRMVKSFQTPGSGADIDEDMVDLARALRGDGRGTFNETEVRRAVRTLRMTDRLRLIAIILDATLPGDIPQQIRLLEKYQKSTFDVLTHLPVDVAVRVLKLLGVRGVLGVEPVSTKWQKLVHHPAIWRHHCLLLTSTDPVPLKPPANLEDWESLYKSLYHRESNWRHALPQRIRFLNGHTNFCTSLLLRGNKLISGSYDETLRIWDVPSSTLLKSLHLKKPISCIDFLPSSSIFVVGFHDVGRVHIYSSITYQPLQQLQGHLYGIRAVALGGRYLVSAGADKALVVWEWRKGTKVVRFGQQTNLNIGVCILGPGGVDSGEGGIEEGDVEGGGEEERLVSVTIDGVVRVFSIKKREMISQFTLSQLGGGDPVLSARLARVGTSANEMLLWFAAKGTQMTCATKSVILHLQWTEESFEEPVVDVTETPPPASATDATSFADASNRNSHRTSLSLSGSGLASRRESGVASSVVGSRRESIAGSVVGGSRRQSVIGSPRVLAASTSGRPSAPGTPAAAGAGVGGAGVGGRAGLGVGLPHTPSAVGSPRISVSGTPSVVASRRISLLTSTPIASGSGTGDMDGESGLLSPSSPGTPITPRDRTTSLKSGPRSSLGGRRVSLTPAASSNKSTPNRLGPLPVLMVQRKKTILTAPPRIIAVVDTPDLAVGAVDPKKRRVVTATRFSSRAGADRRIFVSTHADEALGSFPTARETEDRKDHSDDDSDATLADSASSSSSNPSSPTTPKVSSTPPTNIADDDAHAVQYDTEINSLGGVWQALAQPVTASEAKAIQGLEGELPAMFKGLATPAMNPMAMALSHEEVVVGCADGTIYVMNFVGYQYAKQKAASVQGDGEGVDLSAGVGAGEGIYDFLDRARGGDGLFGERAPWSGIDSPPEGPE